MRLSRRVFEEKTSERKPGIALAWRQSNDLVDTGIAAANIPEASDHIGKFVSPRVMVGMRGMCGTAEIEGLGRVG